MSDLQVESVQISVKQTTADKMDVSEVNTSLKRTATEGYEDEENKQSSKRARLSSPPGDLQIDLNDATEENSLETAIDTLEMASKWTNVFPIRNQAGKLTLIRQHGKRVLGINEQQKTSLLSKPFWDLFLEAEAELARRAEVTVSHLDTSTEDAVVLPEGYQDVEQTRQGGRKDAALDKPQDLLWVDKYRPKGFMDLLSETSLNRVVLQWLKMWDACVFNKEVKTVKPKEPKTDDFKSKFVPRNQLPELYTDLDKWRRPMQPVILLTGSPGLGKTTMAHVLARHCGYNVVELNASDDRSPDAFRSALESSTQMKAVLDKDCRPNCLIIDEIDGAPTQSVAVLIQMLRPEPAAETGKKKKKPKILLRPVICICNDPWVPSLRQLRQQALIIQVPSTQQQRLVGRLQEVLRKERMKFDASALQALSEKTGNDIRSCLSTLQFLYSKKKAISITDVAGINVGNKDTQHSLMNVLNSVFLKPREVTSSVRRPMRIEVSTLAQSFGDYERINQALFDTYIHRNGLDSEMTVRVPMAMEWLCFADQTQHLIHRTQNYSMMAYGSYTAARFHTLFATYRGTKNVMANSFAEFYQKRQKMENHMSSLLSFLPAPIMSCHSAQNLLLDVLPFIMGIIQPQMKSSNIQLLNDVDRVKFKSAINIMACFGLTYQQRLLEGHYSFQLEPNIEEVLRFPGVAASFPTLPYAAKMMFSRELDLQKFRSGDVVSKSVVHRKPQDQHQSQTAQAKKCIAPKGPKVRRDFFGRVITIKEEPIGQELTTAKKPTATGLSAMEHLTAGVYYKFKEGFTNAVRKNITIQQFLNQ